MGGATCAMRNPRCTPVTRVACRFVDFAGMTEGSMTALSGGLLPSAEFARSFRLAVRRWYADHGRDLGFRRSRKPWGVLVSEVILQQTQVARVEEAWPRFVARFPNPAALVAASPADVLREWAGLGYNRRALNLWR